MNPEETIDYDSLYGGEDIDMSDFKPSKKVQKGYEKYFGKGGGDWGKQFIKETAVGVGGAYGDIADMLGLHKKPPYREQAEEEKNYQDFATLDKMNEPGYKPSIEDIASLTSDDSDLMPSFRLPTSHQVRGAAEALGAPGEPETIAGRYGKRQGTLYGQGLAFGQANPTPALVAGGLSQTAAEGGAPELMQAGIEIAALILSGGKGAKNQSVNKEIQSKIDLLRKAGYTEEDITLAVKAAQQRGGEFEKGGRSTRALTQTSTKGQKTESSFSHAIESTERAVDDILGSGLPGMEKGAEHVHQIASDTYGAFVREAAALPIKDSSPFINAATDVVRELKNTLGPNPEAGPLLNRLWDAVMATTKTPNADTFVKFYQELNKMGGWINRSQKDRLLTRMKNGIKETFEHEGPEGRKLLTKFEEANEAVQKAYKAVDANNLLQKANTPEGWNFSSLKKLFNKPENWKTVEDALGPEATTRLYQIARTGSEIKDFDKVYKGVKTALGYKDIAAVGGAGYYFAKGDYEKALLILGLKSSTKLGSKLSEKFLTDPKFQSINLKLLSALKDKSPRAFKVADDAMRQYLEDEGIPIDNY